VTFDDLHQLLDEHLGLTGIYAEALAGDLPPVSVNADVPFALASVVKLPLLVHLLRQVEQNRLSLDLRLTLSASDRVPGSGILKELLPGVSLTVYDLMVLMMALSDNTATDKLFGLTSKAAVQADMQALGYQSIFIPQTIREMLISVTTLGPEASFEALETLFAQAERAYPKDPQGSSSTRGDRATPADIGRLLVDIYQKRLLSSEMREVALTILKGCRYTDRIPARLPKGTVVAHKTGTLRGVTNDVGIVLAEPVPYVIALFHAGEPDATKASQHLAIVSEMIFSYFNPASSAPAASSNVAAD
jgi:beta-lactamase class A